MATAVPGVEEWRDGAYRRTLRLPHGNGVVALRPLPDHVECRLALDDLRDLTTAIARCRRLLDLDADPEAVDQLLAPTTRWQGTTMETGFRPLASPTAREAPGLPIRAASSP